MSGYFTRNEKVKSVKNFYFSRLERLLVPYIIWSLLYLGLRGKLISSECFKILVTGDASWQLYYIIVLLQCVLLTPMFIRFNVGLKFSVIAFLGYMLIKYYYLWKGMKWLSFPLCIEYLPFYTLGIWAGNNNGSIKLKESKILIFSSIPLFAGVSFVEAVMWNNQGKQAMAMSQGKITSYCFAMSVIMLFWVRATSITEKNVKKYANRVLEKIGNLSYGFFFAHMLFVYLIQKVWNLIGYDIDGGLIYCVINFIFVVTGTYLFVFIINKIVPKRVANFLGML